MNSSFEYTVAGSTRTYFSDNVKIDLRIDGDQQRLISGDLDQDIRDIELIVTVKQVWEQVSGTDNRPTQMWLDLLAETNIVFKPDTGEDGSFVIVADITHPATFLATIKGTKLETVALKFRSLSVYQPTDTVMTDLAAIMPFFTGT